MLSPLIASKPKRDRDVTDDVSEPAERVAKILQQE